VQAGLLTRHLQDLPANILTPPRFAEIAEGLFKGTAAKVKIHGPRELKEYGMGAFLAVAQGSPIEPRMIEIDIPGKSQDQTIALVGKGLTFDSGGISIKGAAGMGEMKFDMSGGAAVLGAAWFLQKVKPSARTVCLIGAVENMPSGSAIRPGDIVQTMNGKTVEILNTDAEGRLVLCDVLTYAQRQFKPTLVADIATLTGAVLHGLGHAGAAYLTHNEKTAKLVYDVGQLYGEPLWRLPLWPELAKEVKSETADLANIPKPSVAAGTIIGATYLREFIEQADTEWVHLDIAGTAWACAATGYPEGAGSAFGLRTLIGLAMRYTA
jgi:leucyl aminopeptidase